MFEHVRHDVAVLVNPGFNFFAEPDVACGEDVCGFGKVFAVGEFCDALLADGDEQVDDLAYTDEGDGSLPGGGCRGVRVCECSASRVRAAWPRVSSGRSARAGSETTG